MTWSDRKIKELTQVIKEHKGYGESPAFYKLKEEIVAKLGRQNWERILRKAKIKSVN